MHNERFRKYGDVHLIKPKDGHPKHGATADNRFTPEYMSWVAAKARCFNQNTAKYAIYGARGITMCERWRMSFSDFLADMGPRPKGKTLDRINNDGNYEPDNCRWATAKEQMANRGHHVIPPPIP